MKIPEALYLASSNPAVKDTDRQKVGDWEDLLLEFIVCIVIKWTEGG